LCRHNPWVYGEAMSDTPFKLNRGRILLLALGALALTYIIGALLGGVANYRDLREARDAALSSSQPAP
jgi:hypothetical protein